MLIQITDKKNLAHLLDSLNLIEIELIFIIFSNYFIGLYNLISITPFTFSRTNMDLCNSLLLPVFYQCTSETQQPCRICRPRNELSCSKQFGIISIFVASIKNRFISMKYSWSKTYSSDGKIQLLCSILCYKHR